MTDTFTMGATTRYYGATSARGSRIRVDLANGAVATVPYDHSGNAHVSAVTNVARRAGFEVHDVTYLTGSESGMGGVYVVTVSEGVSA
jgi:hypothetical protein